MTRTLTVRKPTRRESQELELMLEGELSSQARRRAETIVYHALGLSGRQLAEALHVHPNTVYADLQAFEREGLACVRPLPCMCIPILSMPTCKPLSVRDWHACAPYQLAARRVGFLTNNETPSGTGRNACRATWVCPTRVGH